jgi:D-alanine-D-alanine ligase
MRSFDFADLVLVADMWDEVASISSVNSDRRDLEQTDESTLKEILEAANLLGLSTHHYLSPAELAQHADQHKKDLVLSIYGGSSSRNRMAITPAICEAFELRYIGPDVYGRIIAQDKGISKRLAVDCGVLTPAWRIVRTEEEALIAARLPPPVVVKPLLEGSSIGISAFNLQHTEDGTLELTVKLLRQFDQPVLIEQFVSGREVSYTKIQNSFGDDWGLSEVTMSGDDDYFSGRLFHADEKLVRDPRRTVRNIDSDLLPEDKAGIDRMLAAFGHYGYCRVDGRLRGGRFHFLELSPDAWLGRAGQFAMSYTEKGWDYHDVIAAVLASVPRAPQARLSNG